MTAEEQMELKKKTMQDLQNKAMHMDEMIQKAQKKGICFTDKK